MMIDDALGCRRYWEQQPVPARDPHGPWDPIGQGAGCRLCSSLPRLARSMDRAVGAAPCIQFQCHGKHLNWQDRIKEEEKKEIVLNFGISQCTYLNDKSFSPHFDS